MAKYLKYSYRDGNIPVEFTEQEIDALEDFLEDALDRGDRMPAAVKRVLNKLNVT